jgi:hypothetical protein
MNAQEKRKKIHNTKYKLLDWLESLEAKSKVLTVSRKDILNYDARKVDWQVRWKVMLVTNQVKAQSQKMSGRHIVRFRSGVRNRFRSLLFKEINQ